MQLVKIVIILGLSMLVRSQLDSNRNIIKTRVVSGAYTRRLPQVLTYTSSAPLIYQMTFNISSIQRGNFITPNCPAVRQNECKVYEGIEKIINELETKLTVVQNSLSSYPFGINAMEAMGAPSRSTRNVVSDSIGDFLSFCCSVATQSDIGSIFTSQAKQKQVFNKLKNSIITDHSNILMIQKGYKDFSSNVSTVMNTFKDVMQQMITKQRTLQNEYGVDLEWITTLEHKMTYIQLQTVQALAKSADLFHYSDILSHCRNKLLSFSAVSLYELTRDLYALQSEVRKNSYELAIHPSNAIAYYSQKFASCQFADNQITIQMKIPLKEINEDWILHELIQVPFQYEGSICTIDHQPTLLAVSNDDVIALQGTALETCRPSEGICWLPAYNIDPLEGSHCSRMILKGATASALKRACMFTCRKLPPETHFVTQLDNHRFVITNAPRGTAITCDVSESHTLSADPILLPVNNKGAVEVSIPCYCYIRIPGRRRPVRPPYPCPASNIIKPTIHNVLPSHWTKIDVNVLSEYEMGRSGYHNNLNSVGFDRMEDILNTSWALEQP